MNIFEIKPNIDRTKLKRPTKCPYSSDYKKYPHTTINGQGIIARLRRKNKRRKRI